MANDRKIFQPGRLWTDTDGNPIQAHGGGIIHHEGTYYWYGENKGGPTKPSKGCDYRVDVVGVSCYSSQDLYTWKHEGIVLPSVTDEPEHDLHTSKVVERPKVLFNRKTNRFVMWVHIDVEDYSAGKVGVAVGDSPVGPFQYLGSMHPNGADSRDFTIYADDDGEGYLLHSSEWNKTLYIAKLTEDYLQPTGEFTRQFIEQHREAPAVFKRAGRYYMISSGCTGWSPNEALVASADAIMGPWTLEHNPCVGPDAEWTFHGQSTFVLPLADKPDSYIFMADRWIKECLSDSRYIWLPIQFHDETCSIPWLEEWELSVFNEKKGALE